MFTISTLRTATVLFGLLVALPARPLRAAPPVARLARVAPSAGTRPDTADTTTGRRRYGVIPRVWHRIAAPLAAAQRQPLLHLRVGRFALAVQSPAERCALVVSVLKPDAPGAPLAFGLGF
ncbi:hypothetical protein [Hymenobacter antarcticus]|uniref:Secreted protein n=1 Tax=Hymenobacter antarcticus TaxID=486270 RepID=A0ABP7QWK9_9BACT